MLISKVRVRLCDSVTITIRPSKQSKHLVKIVHYLRQGKWNSYVGSNLFPPRYQKDLVSFTQGRKYRVRLRKAMLNCVSSSQYLRNCPIIIEELSCLQ